MNILFLSAVLPYPLYSGGQVRIYNLLRQLSHKHQITLCTFLRRPEERSFVENLSFLKHVETVLRGHAWQSSYVLSSLVSSYPLLMETYNNVLLRNRIADLLKRDHFDLIHIEPSYVFSCLPVYALPLVVAEHNIEYMVYEGYIQKYPLLRPLLAIDVAKLKRWEEKIWQKAQHVVTVSEQDKAVVANVIRGDVTVISNGVDIAEFRVEAKLTNIDAPIFLFVGNFAWVQNRDALGFLLRDIWPKLLTLYPRACLRIVGHRMPESLRQETSRAHAILLENVVDIRDEFAGADMLLAPLRVGGGTKFKILEAMATGVPVITTPVGAQGLMVHDKKELRVADTCEDFIAAVSDVLNNKNARERMTGAARSCIENNYTWDTISNRLASVWEASL